MNVFEALLEPHHAFGIRRFGRRKHAEDNANLVDTERKETHLRHPQRVEPAVSAIPENNPRRAAHLR